MRSIQGSESLVGNIPQLYFAEEPGRMCN